MAASNESLSRYRPIIYIITGAAATYSIYALYSALSQPQSSRLRRSNAVHRRQRPANLPSIPGNESASPPSSRPPLYVRYYSDHGQFVYLEDNQLLIAPLGLDHEYELQCSPDHAPQWQSFLISAQEGLRRAGRPDPSEATLVNAWELYYTAWGMLHVYQNLQWPSTVTAGRYNAAMNLIRGLGLTLSQSRQCMQVFVRNISRFPSPPNGQAALDAQMDMDGTETVAGTEVSFQTADEAAMTGEQRERRVEGQNLKSMLYYIAEEQARIEGYIHRGVQCNSCDMKPIRGIRWRCANCADYDLCTDCEAMGMHDKTHIFFKVRIPTPYLSPPRQGLPIMFPGKPQLMPRYVPKAAKKKLMSETTYEGSEIDALYDQFTCLANHKFKSDPNKIMGAIDRAAFDKAFVPGTSVNPPRPNLIYDRLFDFYDTNRDGLIDFEEFLKGLAALRAPLVNHIKLRPLFNGYDVDSDGYVTRKDFLRMFRAYYAIQREITKDCLLVNEEDATIAANMDTIQGSQPLSSVFTDLNFPSHNGLPRHKDENSLVVHEDTAETEERTAIVYATKDDEDPVLDGWEWDEVSEAAYPVDRQILDEQRIAEERWLRREFYTDVEEGMSEPDHCIHWGPTDDFEDYRDCNNALYKQNMTSSGKAADEGSRPVSPRSRSSSKVRFQDDLEMETRSNCSTSSRPVGERWGGYEIPEPERDLGKDILYQVTQQGLNELLDPLFSEKENLALEMYNTAGERQRWRKEIDNFVMNKDRVLNESMEYLSHMFDGEPLEEPEPIEATHGSVSDGKGKGKEEAIILESERRILNAPLDELLEVSGYRVSEGIEAVHVGNGATVKPHSLTNGNSLKTHGQESGHGTTANDSILDASGGNADDAKDSECQKPTIHQNGAVHEPKTSVQQSSSQSRDTDNGSAARADDKRSDEHEEAATPEDSSNSTKVDEFPPLETPETTSVDPTMPQFRPNSSAEVLEWVSKTSLRGATPPTAVMIPTPIMHGIETAVDNAVPPPEPTSAAAGPSNPRPTRSNPLYIIEGVAVTKAEYDAHIEQYKRELEHPPSDKRLERLAMLDKVEAEVRERGGPGRLDWVEFESFMCGPQGKTLAFVEAWLDVGSF